jgi:acyl-CoA thioester hydrolase
MSELFTQKKSFPIESYLSVQTYDIDFAGIVSNIVYIRWLEDLRLKMMEKYLPLNELLPQNYCPTLASTQIEYKQALRLFDRPIGKMWMSKLGRLRFTIHAEIYHQQKLVTQATQVGFFVNINTMRPMTIPQKFVELYQKHSFS